MRSRFLETCLQGRNKVTCRFRPCKHHRPMVPRLCTRYVDSGQTIWLIISDVKVYGLVYAWKLTLSPMTAVLIANQIIPGLVFKRLVVHDALQTTGRIICRPKKQRTPKLEFVGIYADKNET